MARLTRLTPDQEAILHRTREDWLDLVFGGRVQPDPAALTDAMAWLYDLAGLEPPTVLLAGSPLGCQVLAAHLRCYLAEQQVGQPVRQQVWQQVGEQVRRQVRQPVEQQVWQQVGERVGYQEPCTTDLLWDAGWTSVCDAYRRLGVVDSPALDAWIAYLRQGVWYGIFLQGLAVVCGPPQILRRDPEHRLHSAEGPALRWSDGWALYAWHGVIVPPALIERPDTLTRDDLAQERNAEVRRAMREVLGTERFAGLLDLVVVDRDTIGAPGYAQEYVLWRTREPDPVAEEHLQFVQVRCHSTGREYMLTVPPDMGDVYRAVAWTFGKMPETYRPEVEA